MIETTPADVLPPTDKNQGDNDTVDAKVTPNSISDGATTNSDIRNDGELLRSSGSGLSQTQDQNSSQADTYQHGLSPIRQHMSNNLCEVLFAFTSLVFIVLLAVLTSYLGEH